VIATQASTITEDALFTMLEQLKLQPESVRSTDGGVMYRIKQQQGRVDYHVLLSQSSSGKFVWLSVPLTYLPEPSKTSSDMLEKLLTASYDHAPAHFTLKSNRRVFLDVAIESANLNAFRLRDELIELGKIVEKTEPLWNR
jgi:hypothetical protein